MTLPLGHETKIAGRIVALLRHLALAAFLMHSSEANLDTIQCCGLNPLWLEAKAVGGP